VMLMSCVFLCNLTHPTFSFWSWHLRDLVLAGVYFALGFASTNLSFSGASAAFVETVKAAEPITSAATAVIWGIEVLSVEEGTSLVTIVAGVLLSTLGNTSGGDGASLADSIRSCVTVMIANLCFSFRGLHQKLFRAAPHGSKNSLDDLNLQFRMQQVGILLLIGPVIIWDFRILLSQFSIPSSEFLGLALVNGFAFTSYK
jgi:drug/metabolite transporter (DMT)-like permease